MKNKEKYAKEIVDIVCDGGRVAVKNGKPQNCDTITTCVKCDLRKDGIYCRKEFKKWCNEEYVEPQVDWSKVPVDTPIWVRCSKDAFWAKRHFAGYQDGVVIAFSDGRTSWDCFESSAWNYAKLATADELNENSILQKGLVEKE